jgi:Rps23 Pro-64 3,4-dihydroxylase Tpa1-like proline 4-hydroxylase
MITQDWQVTSRQEYVDLICSRLEGNTHQLRADFRTSNRIKYFYVDNLLPSALAHRIYEAFPPKEDIECLKSLTRYKHIASPRDISNPILDNVFRAFYAPEVMEIISQCTGIQNLVADEDLGGLSIMDRGCFLNPHLDKSHDKSRENYKVLNLLYYISPDWQESYGGNLELWPNGVKGNPVTIHSRFNRLVVMATDLTAWHSVSPVKVDQNRCALANKYFAPFSPAGQEYYHKTTFRGRPEQPILDFMLTYGAKIRATFQ